ncbi:hypothetical protein F5B22DRAFT_335366 [Xylaria bambusicola]|uniref:uncharacterized protein n=1 Tax=Xylaria bambusicola TaxID=326684 RepID=UPI002007811F|nr:uncharacterized protein F5B22DRAFT_335366 [Xylaria bambusicola]KAI0525357.1 hypothetical protein F5B22DRAFT_335366 [Xylaria bambusicola]
MPVLDALWQRQAAAILKRTTARTPRPSIHRFKPQAKIRSHIRFQSTNPKPPSSSTAPNPSQPTAQTNRISQILTRASRFLPKRLQTSLHNLRSAPLSHVGAFLVLHEITAILPIFGLTYAFHALDWVPTSWVLGPFAAWAEDGLKKYVPYFRRKNWFGLGGEDKHGSADGEEVLESELREEVEREKERESREGKGGWFGRFSRREDENTPVGNSASSASSERVTSGGESNTAAAVWRKVKHAATVDNTEKGYKIGIQIAAAYTITKILLVPRVALSLWLTPWLARSLIGLRQAIRRKRS